MPLLLIAMASNLQCPFLPSLSRALLNEREELLRKQKSLQEASSGTERVLPVAKHGKS